MSNSSCEVGLLSLIGSGFQFGVNRFEKEYLRKCAFWQRLQAGMYGAHVSLEIGVGSLGSPLECTPLLHPPPRTTPATRLTIPREGVSARRKGKYSCNTTTHVSSNQLSTHACKRAQHSHFHWCTHTHTNNKKEREDLMNVWNEWKKNRFLPFKHPN